MKLSQKKNDILATVEQYIIKEELINISVRQISKAAGINVAMISYYFGSKDKMMVELFKYRLNKITNNIQLSYKNISNHPSWEYKLEEVIGFCIDEIFGFHAFHEVISQIPEIKNKCQKEINNFHLTILDIFTTISNDSVSENESMPTSSSIKMLVANIIGTTLFFIKNPDFYTDINISKNVDSNNKILLTSIIKSYLKKSAYLTLNKTNEH